MSAMNDSLMKNETFDEKSVMDRVFKEVELPFTLDRTVFPTTPQGTNKNIF